MSITAIVENDTIKLPPGMHVPDGTRAEIILPGEEQAGPPEKTAGRQWSPEELGEAAAEMVAEKDGVRAEALKRQIVAGFYGDADALGPPRPAAARVDDSFGRSGAGSRNRADQLTLLARWLIGEPEVPAGPWFKRFPGMIACGEGELMKTFLRLGQVPAGQEVM